LLLAEDYNNYNNNNNNVYLNVNNFTVFMSYFLNLCHVGYKNNKRLHQIISRHLEPYTNTLYTIYTYTFVYINYIRVTLQFTHTLFEQSLTFHPFHIYSTHVVSKISYGRIVGAEPFFCKG